MGTSETRARVQADTISAGAAVDLDFASVRLEVCRRILRRDTALDCKATLGDVLLCESELGERSTCSNLNLSCHNVDTGDLL